MKKLIIFDLDNTLYDYNKINDKCYEIVINNIIEKTGKPKEIINSVIKQAKLKVKRTLEILHNLIQEYYIFKIFVKN